MLKSKPNPFYLIDVQRIGTARKGECFAELAKPPSDKLTQVYLALVNLCAPLGYIAFLRPKLESVAGSQSRQAGIKDKAYWRLAKPELAVCDSEGKLKLAVIKSTTKRVHKEDLENLRVPYRHLSGLEPPEKEAATLLAAAKLPTVDICGTMSPPQLTTAKYLSRYLRIGISADKAHVQPRQSKLTRAQRDELEAQPDAVGHYVRTRNWFLVNEVALSSLVVPNKALLSEASVGFVGFSSVDMVIYSARPSPMPILAVEFDGVTYHSDSAAVARDNLKTALLTVVGIPLLRISSIDGHFVPWSEASNAQKNEIETYFGAVGMLVLSLVSAVNLERRKQLERDDEFERHARAVDQLSMATFNKPFSALIKGQQDDILKSDAYDSWVWNDLIEQGMSVEREEPPTAYEMLKVELSKFKISGERLRTYSAKRRDETVRAVALVLLPNGKTRYVEGPAVAVRLFATPQNFINEAVLFAFSTWMAHEVRMVLDNANGS